MAHFDPGAAADADLSEAGSVFRNRPFVYLWSAQALAI